MYVILSAKQKVSQFQQLTRKKIWILFYYVFAVGQLTNYPVDPFGFVLPPNTHKVDGDSSQHDDHAQATHHWFRVQAEAQQHSPEDHVGDGHQHVHLHTINTDVCSALI